MLAFRMKSGLDNCKANTPWEVIALLNCDSDDLFPFHEVYITYDLSSLVL